MYNESRGRMDEAQQWYEKTMGEVPADQGALKRQISQVPPFIGCKWMSSAEGSWMNCEYC